MRHAREDYDRIQDPSGLIPAEEPVFLLRGQDKHAAATLRFYAGLIALDAAAGPASVNQAMQIIDATMEHAERMDAWPRKKSPDL